MSKNFDLLRGVRSIPEPIRSSNEKTMVWSRPAASADQSGSDWTSILNILRRHWRLSAIFACAMIAAVTTVTLMMKPIYEPEAQIEVDSPGTEVFSLQEGVSGQTSPEYLATQAQKLEGDELALETVRTLRLDRNPEFAGPFAANSDQQRAPETDPPQLTKAENTALKVFLGRLHVRRDTASRLISVKVGSHDPELAAKLTNTHVNLFVERTHRNRHDAIMQSSEWLSRQLEDIRQRMDKSNQVLAEFQRTTGIADVGETGTSFSQEMAELNRQLVQAQADRIQMESFLGRLTKSGPESLPQIGANPVIQNLTQKLADARAELAKTRAVYGEKHPTVKKLHSQINELEAQLAAQRRSIVAEFGTTYAAARAREQLLADQVKGASKQLSQMAQYNALKKEAEANAQLYSTLYARVKEAGISAASKSSNARVVNRARVLEEPSRPDRLFNIAIGLLVGVVGGVSLAFVREHFDTGIYTPEDVRKYTGIAHVAVVPIIKTATGASLLPRRVPLLGQGTSDSRYKFFLENPLSPEAEALRAIYTSIMFTHIGVGCRALLLVSAFPLEGKTTLAVNLASALALHGKTCVVDADIRKPDVGRAFDLAPSPGLVEVLSGAIELDEVLVSSPQTSRLMVLQSGTAPPDPGQVFWLESTHRLIRELRDRFDFLVVDAPPILPYADARALAALVDGVILVGRPGVTTREAMQRSLELLAQANSAPVLEIVLNGADSFSPECRYYHNGYSGQAQR